MPCADHFLPLSHRPCYLSCALAPAPDGFDRPSPLPLPSPSPPPPSSP